MRKSSINDRYYQTKKYQNNVSTIGFQNFRINLSPFKSVLLVLVITDNLEEFGQLCWL